MIRFLSKFYVALLAHISPNFSPTTSMLQIHTKLLSHTSHINNIIITTHKKTEEQYIFCTIIFLYRNLRCITQ